MKTAEIVPIIFCIALVALFVGACVSYIDTFYIHPITEPECKSSCSYFGYEYLSSESSAFSPKCWCLDNKEIKQVPFITLGGQ